MLCGFYRNSQQPSGALPKATFWDHWWELSGETREMSACRSGWVCGCSEDACRLSQGWGTSLLYTAQTGEQVPPKRKFSAWRQLSPLSCLNTLTPKKGHELWASLMPLPSQMHPSERHPTNFNILSWSAGCSCSGFSLLKSCLLRKLILYIKLWMYHLLKKAKHIQVPEKYYVHTNNW